MPVLRDVIRLAPDMEGWVEMATVAKCDFAPLVRGGMIVSKKACNGGKCCSAPRSKWKSGREGIIEDACRSLLNHSSWLGVSDFELRLRLFSLGVLRQLARSAS